MSLSKKDIENGFWNIQNRKPEYLNYDNDQIFKVNELGIGFKNEENKTKELKFWTNNLEELDNVEYLWTYHKVNQAFFEAICKMKNLKGLWIKWSSIKDLSCIKQQLKLEHLHLGLSTRIESIGPICHMRNLITFESENLKKVKDWTNLSNLTQLEGLGIHGGMYERLKLDKIDFVSDLKNLKYLFLIATNIQDKSLKPIEGLKELMSLKLTNDWSDEECRKLRASLPNLKFGNVANDKQNKYLKSIFGKK